MERTAFSAAKEIFTALMNEKSDHPSLHSGNTGILLLKYLFTRHFPEEQYPVNLQDEVQLLAEKSLSMSYFTFCNGKSGVNWFFSFLFKESVLEEEDNTYLMNDNCDLASLTLQMLSTDNYDYLHGAIGIAYQLLYTGFKYEAFYKKVIDKLLDLSYKSANGEMVPYYDLMTSSLDSQKVNPSLSHGLSSILKFLLECCKKNIAVESAKPLAERIVNYLVAHANEDKDQSYFPSLISFDNTTEYSYSRLAWCYGDLGIAYILYQAGVLLKRTDIVDFALEVFLFNTKRRTLKQTMVYDAGICHGAAGVAHIYNRMWMNTRNPIFKETTEYWIKETLAFACFEDGIAGFKKFNAITKTYERDSSLLEGIAGTGLVLLSYLTNDFSWDYCIMLND
jgi:hypothetical protein